MDLVIRYALSFVGIPYLYGGKNPLVGLDCSGLVCEILKSCGVLSNKQVDLSAQELYDYLEKNASINLWKAGSIAFYGSNVTQIHHVTFCLDPYLSIGADGGSPDVLNLGVAKLQSAFVKMRPIKYRTDVACVLRPDYAAIGII